MAADAGSIYLVRKGEQEHRYLYFALAQNDKLRHNGVPYTYGAVMKKLIICLALLCLFAINLPADEGLTIGTPAEVSAWADVIMILAPDTKQRFIYTDDSQRPRKRVRATKVYRT